MKLLVISHTPHYHLGDQIVGWGPTVRELDYLSQLFTEVRHIACLYDEPAPASALPYSASNLQLVPVSPSGGETLAAKVSVLQALPEYWRTLVREMKTADFIHVRCPANLSLLAIILLAFYRKPKWRWAKYAGNWRPTDKEARSYTLQRWWLHYRLHRGVVTVNGKWPDQPRYVYSFFNPSLTLTEVEKAKKLGQQKQLKPPYFLLFVGNLNDGKGVGRVLQIAQKLQTALIPFELHFLGDGPERPKFEAQSEELGIVHCTYFHGWLPKPALADYYARAHFIVFPSSSEGWPKVLSEAMAYGAVPISSNVSSIPQILSELGTGLALPPKDIDAFVQAIADYVAHPDQWHCDSEAGMTAAVHFTYEHYLNSVRLMCLDSLGLELAQGSGQEFILSQVAQVSSQK